MRIALLALALLPWSALSEGQCDANGVCSPMDNLPIEGWWREELTSTQPACSKIDPQNKGTCHQWTVELTEPAQEVVKEIKTKLADYISATSRIPETSRILEWNDPMDELYLSAPGNQVGSDKVFVTPHMDGFFGFIPFVRAWRCVYGLSGPHETVTFQPMRNPDDRSVTLGPGIFACFDYNREIHWIENIPNSSIPHPKERIVLKLHFYDYPALLPKWLGDAFGRLNVEYNFFARRAFLVSQFPDQSALAKFVGGVINGITNYGGSTEVYFGYVNIGILVAFLFATHFRLRDLMSTLGLAHFGLYFLAFIFRSTPLGMFVRDAYFFKGMSLLLYGLGYGSEMLKSGLTPQALLSLVVAGGGLYLSTISFLALGPDITYFGRQFGLVPDTLVTTFPYDGTIPHPMILGSVVFVIGMRLHPTFGKKFHTNFLLNLLCYAGLLGLELTNFHIPKGANYFSTYADFIKYHQVPANVLAHLFTTGIGLIGVLGLLNIAFQPTGKTVKRSEITNAPLITLAWTWIIVRYTVPDTDVANVTVFLMTVFATIAWQTRLSVVACLVLLAASVGLQEAAHHYYGEVTYMASYAAVTPEAAGTFLLHNIWLLPFELRAAINAASASVLPSAAL